MRWTVDYFPCKALLSSCWPLRDKCPCIGASGRSAPENLSYSLLQRKRADEEEEGGGCRTEQGTVMQIHSLCN